MHFPDLADPRDRTLHGVLRRQAAAIPDATYLRVDDDQISFAEVERAQTPGRRRCASWACRAAIRSPS